MVATIDSMVRASLSREPPSGLVAWIDLVRAWNRKIDLTAARTDEELVDLLVADAVILADRIAGDAKVVDVGSGAGAPGLPLALLRPDLEVTLVEPMQKRVAFLRTAVGTLGSKNVRVERARGEDVAKAGSRFDVAISRATLPPAEWLALGRALAPSVWILLAQGDPPEAGATDDVRYAWPLTAASRRAVLFR